LVALQDDLVDCTYAGKELARLTKWFEIFQDKSKIFPTIFANLGKNYVDIVHELDIFNQDMAKQDFVGSGARISDIVTDTLGPLPDQASIPVPHVNPDDFEQFVTGFLRESTKDKTINIDGCFHDLKNGAGDLETIIGDFKSFKETKNMFTLVDAISHLGDILVGLPDDLIDCTYAGKELARLTKWFEIFQDKSKVFPTILANLGKNYVDIVHQLDLFNGVIAKKDFVDSGARISDIVTDTIGALPSQDIDNLPLTQW